jgi:hypothetical protein
MDDMGENHQSMDAPPTESPPTLDYAPAPPFVKRKIFAQICWGIAVCVVCWIGLRLLPAVIQRARLMYWQDRCLSYTPPKDLVITSGKPFAPREWSVFSALLPAPALTTHSTLFMHERRTPSGRRRLVIVELFGTALRPRVMSIATFRATAAELHWDRTWLKPLWVQNSLFLVGQPDPDDPSHFTFSFREGSADSTAAWTVVDGWLQDDDTVLLEPRACTTPAPPPASGRSP